MRSAAARYQQRLTDAKLSPASRNGVESQLQMHTFQIDMASFGPFSRGSMIYNVSEASLSAKTAFEGKTVELNSQIQQLSNENARALSGELGKLGWTD